MAYRSQGHSPHPAQIKYACVWEDADILCESLKPVAKGGRLLSIASSGDNTLSLLTLDPDEIVAVDTCPAQIACTELKIAAFRDLNYQTIIEFLGISPCDTRWEIYLALRDVISDRSRSFWDLRREVIERGLIHSGTFESTLRFFGQKILPRIRSRWKINFLLEPHTEEERRDFYQRHWDTLVWKCLLKAVFSPFAWGRRAKDPALAAHFQGSLSERISRRTQTVFTTLETMSNPYLVYILKGNYAFHALPHYLREENYQLIKSRLTRVALLKGPIEMAEGKFAGFNLSDIFEYMRETEYQNCYESLLEMADPSARMVYWNMLVPRGRPCQFKERVSELREEADRLQGKDKAWYYHDFHIDQVLPI